MKQNQVFLTGWLMKSRIVMDPKTKLYRYGDMILMTVRPTHRANDAASAQVRWDVPEVYSRNQKMIETGYLNEVSNDEEAGIGDIVFVKGNLVTADINRRFKCRHCGNVQEKPASVMVYVDPIYIEAKEHDLTRLDAARILREQKQEVSNSVTILGTVCREVRESDFFERQSEKGADMFQFQIAVRRPRRIPEDPPEKDADFPWVKVYGAKAREYSKAIHKGSSLIIDGALQTRSIVYHDICHACGQVIEQPGFSTEIVPYSIEYLDHCDIPFEPVDLAAYDEDRDGYQPLEESGQESVQASGHKLDESGDESGQI